MTQTYRTVREAGIAATLEAMARARKDGFEHGGYILKKDGRFVVSDIVTIGDPHSVNLGAALPNDLMSMSETKRSAWRDTHLAGMFHVHISGDSGYSQYHEWFSPNDLRSAISTRGMAYLGSAATDRIFELDATSVQATFTSAAEKDISIGEDGPEPVAKGTLVYEGKGFAVARARIARAEKEGKRDRESLVKMFLLASLLGQPLPSSLGELEELDRAA